MTTTVHLQKLPDYYIGQIPPNNFAVNTNSRYRRFNQLHFTAGDEQQFQTYRDFSNDKNTGLESDSRWKFRGIDWRGYQNLDKKYINSTFHYIFDKFKKGIFVKIHNNQLKVFLPFSKANYVNEWSNYIQHDPSSYSSISDFIKFCGRLQNYNIPDKKINAFTNTWYANNFLFRPEFPTGEGDSGMGCVKDMLLELCKNRTIPDIEFFINKRDLPLLKRDFTEPYSSMFNNNKLPLLTHRYDKYYPILSMTTTEDYADIPIPTIEDWARVSNIEDNKVFIPPSQYRYDFSKPFHERRPIAVFRGASTGERTTLSSNMRLKIALMSSQQIRDEDDEELLLDAGITKWNTRPRKEYGKKYLTTIDYTKFPFGLVDKLTPEQQSNYKYIVNIDGHSSAFRLCLELSMGSVVLLVGSKYKLWIHDMIRPYEHYVPIREDLSDLYDIIRWCKNNENKCLEIINNARNFYNQSLSRNGIFDYLQNLLIQLRHRMGWHSFYNDKKIEDIQLILEYKKLHSGGIIDIPPSPSIIEKGGITLYKYDTYCIKKISSSNINKYREGIHEIFISQYILEKMKSHINNFTSIFEYSINDEMVLIKKQWIEGKTLMDWITTRSYSFENFEKILLQINLILFASQSVVGFIHYDLYPWNIVIKTYDTPQIINYPYPKGKHFVIETRVVPYIIDYGKSSGIYKGVRYGNSKICSIHDTLTILFSSLYEVLKVSEDNRIIQYLNFISNTRYRYKKFKYIREAKSWIKMNKKYDILINTNKYELGRLTPIDFIEYILGCQSKSPNLIPLQIKSSKIPNKENFRKLFSSLDLSNEIVILELYKYLGDIVDNNLLNLEQQLLLFQKTEIDFEQILNRMTTGYINNNHFKNLDNGLINKLITHRICWKKYEMITDVYYPSTHQTLSFYSHTTYNFYMKFIILLNLKNPQNFSEDYIKKIKTLFNFL